MRRTLMIITVALVLCLCGCSEVPQISDMNGWSTGASDMTTIHCMDSYDGKVCYCIEPGVPRNVGDSYSGFGENFWDNYPSQYNNTIEPDDIKVLLGRIMQYGYQGNISTSWKSQTNGDVMAHAIAIQFKMIYGMSYGFLKFSPRTSFLNIAVFSAFNI